MKLSDNICKITVVFLCILYKLLVATELLATNSVAIYSIILLFFGISFLQIINKKIYKRDFLKLCLFVMLGVASILNVESVNYIFPIIIAGVFYDKDNKEKSIKDLIKIFLICLIIGFLTIVILNLIGIIPSHYYIRYKDGIKIIRYSLGFTHPAFVGLYFTFICLGYFALNKPNKKNIVLMTILTIIVYKICDSRTTLICDLIFIIMMIFRNNCILTTLVKKISPYIFVLLTIFTFVSIWLYINYNLKILDEIFSNRLTIYNDIINRLNIIRSPLGVNTHDNIVLDNYYLSIFLYFGIVGYFLWTIFNITSLKKLRDKYVYSAIQVAICIYGMTDSNVIVTSVNFMISLQFLVLLYSLSDYKYSKISTEKLNE